ncbi:MAG TPA: phosphonopyruvate decarboxylase [Gammaproteobacteria bacterium]|nr:phosphonopyruvate decarboxylase [Gammaproteobacteria bacterium]
MIQAEEFVEAARALGYRTYTGVPCSFLTPFINYVINDDRLRYISSANEGDAVAAAAGCAIGGERAVVMMQNSGLGNAVSPLTSLAYVFRIPLLLICTHRGAPGVQDEPQHELMGRITGELFTTMRVPWETFPGNAKDLQPALARAQEHLSREQRPYAYIMEKGAVARHELKKKSLGLPRREARVQEDFSGSMDRRPTRNQALRRVIDLTPEADTVVIATTGYTGRELYALADRKNHFYMVGSMGCASALGLGLALARPDLKVVVADGDGAALMRMGNFATLGAYGAANLYHLVLDNEAHDSTGAQATVTAGVAFARIAQACGYSTCLAGDTPAVIDSLLQAISDGPKFAHLKIKTGTMADLPRPKLAPPEVLRRLMAHIGTSF